jgi:uncharacterized membrane protein YkvA (DUF1232 family)
MKSANPEHWDFYKRFRNRMIQFTADPGSMKSTVREVLMTGPDLLHLAICLVSDPDVPRKHKLILGAAIAYFISPLDLFPEALLGPIGYLDDIAIIAWVLNDMFNQIDLEIIHRYWAGETPALKVVQRITAMAGNVLGKGLYKRVRSFFTIIC